MAPFDILILTAANEAQANGYREQLAWRRDIGLLGPATSFEVVADPGGRRVGSLGATLNVLEKLRSKLSGKGGRDGAKNVFKGRRVLICHSGGDSRRTPAYAAQGKVFTPVPAVAADGVPLALFDLILQTLQEMPAPAGGHVLVTSGDVLLTFDHASVDLTRPGVSGVAYFGTAERGSRHGVYVPEAFTVSPLRTECVSVADFLQKPSVAEARQRGAEDPFGHVAVDTGLLSFDPDACARLLDASKQAGGSTAGGLTGELERGLCPALDLYEDLTMALSPRIDEARFLDTVCKRRGADGAHTRRMRRFYRDVRDIPFQVNVVPYCDFFHIGSSRELLNGFSSLSRTARQYAFANGSGASVTGDDSGAFIFNSCLNAPTEAVNALIEGVHADRCRGLDLKGENILTGLPPEATAPVSLAKGLGMVCLPVGKNGWAAVAYGLDDDFKTPFGGDKPCLFLNAPVEEWLAKSGVKASRLWRGDETDGMWRARLWRIGEIDDVIAEAQAVVRGTGFETRGRRYSLAELIPMTDHGRLLALRQEIRRHVNLLKVAERIVADDTLPSRAVCEDIKNRQDALMTLRRLSALLEDEALREPLLRARVLRLMAMIKDKCMSDDKNAQADLNNAFSAVAEAVAMSFEPHGSPRQAAILHDQVVWVTTPVRIDFDGGWSDTPPICTERGGTVLNAAVTLNGLYPVQVMAKLNTCGSIRLSSIDLGECREIKTTAELLDHSDPHDWAALAKAALILAGVGPQKASEPLSRWLRTLGGGLDLTIFSALPKGSGMGTSSILGAAVIACLERVFGMPFNTDRLICMTSILEQRMCTGGGWQDQVGGIIPGVKLIRTQPGQDQTVSLRWAEFDMSEGSELKRRCLLYFTGQKRMARNILHNVVASYLAREPLTVRTVEELKVSAPQTKEALDARDIDGFAQGITRYWELKKRIDPGSTNPLIEALLQSVKPYTQAALLPGAGGGGFIFMIAKSPADAERIRRALESKPLNDQARFFDFDIDQKGLTVTVL